jgi:hypothetical protein
MENTRDCTPRCSCQVTAHFVDGISPRFSDKECFGRPGKTSHFSDKRGTAARNKHGLGTGYATNRLDPDVFLEEVVFTISGDASPRPALSRPSGAVGGFADQFLLSGARSLVQRYPFRMPRGRNWRPVRHCIDLVQTTLGGKREDERG